MPDTIEVRLRDAPFCFDGTVLEVFGYGPEVAARYRGVLLTNFPIYGESLDVVGSRPRRPGPPLPRPPRDCPRRRRSRRARSVSARRSPTAGTSTGRTWACCS